MMQAYPDIDRTEMFSHLRNCMTNRVPHEMDNEFSFSDGSKAWFELHMEPVPEGVLILSIDITRNKLIEAELTGYRLQASAGDCATHGRTRRNNRRGSRRRRRKRAKLRKR